MHYRIYLLCLLYPELDWIGLDCIGLDMSISHWDLETFNCTYHLNRIAIGLAVGAVFV